VTGGAQLRREREKTRCNTSAMSAPLWIECIDRNFSINRTLAYDREMSSNHQLPDYELNDLRIVSTTQELKALFHPLRGVLTDLVLERSATVNEMAAAVKRPPSSVAHHVGVLVNAGLFKVVRTRKVRSIDERFYGRTARIFYVGQVQPSQLKDMTNVLVEAATESRPAHETDRLRAIHRHARIPQERAALFWDQVFELVRTFSAFPREGETSYAFVAALYPADYPTLPNTEPDSDTS
jgi:DNA-binding transcriptional ArsR family regulator